MSCPHVALVTGASSGIGAEIATALAREGVCVFVGARDARRTARVVERIRGEGGIAEEVRLDVCDAASIAAAVRDAQQTAGRIDWLVNNAGIAVSAPLLGGGTDRDLFEAHLDVNFHGARRVMEAVLPNMLSAGYGRIVQIASSAALYGYPYVSAYCASKHALLGYTRAAALELASKGVAVNTVCPHYVDSPMTDVSVARIVEKTELSETEARAKLAANNPGASSSRSRRSPRPRSRCCAAMKRAPCSS